MTSEFWQHLCTQMDIKHHYTVAYHQQANGLADRTNQTMKQLPRIAQYEGATWFDVIPHAEMANNGAALPGTDDTLFFLNYGFHPCAEADVFSMHAQQNDTVEDPSSLSHGCTGIGPWRIS